MESVLLKKYIKGFDHMGDDLKRRLIKEMLFDLESTGKEQNLSKLDLLKELFGSWRNVDDINGDQIILDRTIGDKRISFD